jgi:hypothetical protein
LDFRGKVPELAFRILARQDHAIGVMAARLRRLGL